MSNELSSEQLDVMGKAYKNPNGIFEILPGLEDYMAEHYAKIARGLISEGVFIQIDTRHFKLTEGGYNSYRLLRPAA